LDELHLIGHGIGKHLFDLITVSQKKTYNACLPIVYPPAVEDDENEDEENEERRGGAELYPFWMEPAKLIQIGELVGESKSTVPVTFASKWVDPIKFSGGNRAVDYINFLLHMLPTCFLPHFTHERAKIPVLKLVKACALALKWELTVQDIADMKR
jgi:hypothetical protein